MGRARCVTGVLLLASCVFAVPLALAAQGGGEPRPRPGVPQTDQQRKGEALFFQNCTLCHVFSGQKKALGIQATTELIGLYKKPTITDATVRNQVTQGLPGFMPSFQYTLRPNDVDDLIAYLRIR